MVKINGVYAEWNVVDPNSWSCFLDMTVVCFIQKKGEGDYTADCFHISNLPTPNSQLKHYKTFHEAEEALFEDEE